MVWDNFLIEVFQVVLVMMSRCCVFLLFGLCSSFVLKEKKILQPNIPRPGLEFDVQQALCL